MARRKMTRRWPSAAGARLTGLVLTATAVVGVTLFVGSASAFKPYTHNYGGDTAYADAVNDCAVTVEKSGLQPRAEALRGVAAQARALQRRSGRPGRLSGSDHGTGNHPSGRRRSGNTRGGRGQRQRRGRGQDGRVAQWVLQKAWAAQAAGSPYGEQEQLEILAFAYGFLTHAAGDMWAHTLVNDFVAGRLPAGQGDPDRPREGEDRVPAHHHRGLHRRRDARASTATRTGPRCPVSERGRASRSATTRRTRSPTSTPPDRVHLEGLRRSAGRTRRDT